MARLAGRRSATHAALQRSRQVQLGTAARGVPQKRLVRWCPLRRSVLRSQKTEMLNVLQCSGNAGVGVRVGAKVVAVTCARGVMPGRHSFVARHERCLVGYGVARRGPRV